MWVVWVGWKLQFRLLEGTPKDIEAVGWLGIVRSSPPRVGVGVPILPTLPTLQAGNSAAPAREATRDFILFFFITLEPGVE